MKNKKAVSLMISYVLLIAIAIGLATGVYAYLKVLANINPPLDCKPETSVILEDKNCYLGGVEFILKNNGRFNISGVVVSVGEDSQKAPTAYLIPQPTGGVIAGHYYFNEPLKPGEIKSAEFTNKEKIGTIEQPITFESINTIQIQPFITDKNQRVVCQNSVIKQEITECQIADLP